MSEEETKTREKAPEQNGIRMPREGSKTRRIWEIADEISSENSRPALSEEVQAAAADEGMNKATVSTQYARWCAFHNVSKEDRSAVRKDLRAEAGEEDEAAAGDSEETDE